MPAIRLQPEHEPAVEELLLRDVAANLFLLGLLDRGLDAWPMLGVPDGDGVRAVALTLSTLVVPYAPDPNDARVIGAAIRTRLRPEMVVGPREACDALIDGWTDARPTRCHDQRLYVVERGPARDGPAVGLRPASLDEAPQIAALGRAMELEDLGRVPADDAAWQATVRDRIAERRTWVVERGGEIVFQVHVGTRHALGCQIGGTYTVPSARGRGFATAAMAALIPILLADHPRVTLHVNEQNTPAVRVYENAGFRRATPFRLARFTTHAQEPG